MRQILIILIDQLGTVRARNIVQGDIIYNLLLVLSFVVLFLVHLLVVSQYPGFEIPLILLNTQLTFTCSKSTTETLEKDVKYVQS